MKHLKKSVVLLLITSFLSSCGNITTTYEVKDYRTVMSFHDNFKIMQLSDIHLGIESNLDREFKFLKESIISGAPDLIVITGDTFLYANKYIVDSFFDFMNNTCKELSKTKLTKFAFTFGNHDNQGDYHRYYINNAIKRYVTSDGNEINDNKYAAFIDYEDDSIYGFTNYYIDLVDENSSDLIYRLHIVDSNSYHFNGISYDYDVIHDDQLSHIENIYNSTTDQDYIGLSFFHIPLYEFLDAKEQYENASNPESIGQGTFNEGVSYGYYNNNSYRRMRDSNILAYFIGHDHINSSDILYNATDESIDDKAIMSYGVKSTDQIYHNSQQIGYKLINLKKDMDKESFLDIKNINENFTNVIDRYELYGKL